MRAWLTDRTQSVFSVIVFIAMLLIVHAFFWGRIAAGEVKSLAVDLWGLIWEAEDR